MPRVAGTDPGTSSLDLLILDDGDVVDQCRFEQDQLGSDPSQPVRWLEARGPFDLITGPSGYGVPLKRNRDCTPADLKLISLVRPDDLVGGGVKGFSAMVSAFAESALPVAFLPGVIHLPTVPAHRKLNKIDMGTPDKLCVAALTLAQGFANCCVVEMGSAFTSCLLLKDGSIVDGVGGTSGPLGRLGAGTLDGETAYLMSPIHKRDLFSGGAHFIQDQTVRHDAFAESVLRCVAGLKTIAPFETIVVSGRLLEMEPDLTGSVLERLRPLANVVRLSSLPDVWVKHAAQGAAIVADALAGGRFAAIAESLALRKASGTVLDWLMVRNGDELRSWFV